MTETIYHITLSVIDMSLNIPMVIYDPGRIQEIKQDMLLQRYTKMFLQKLSDYYHTVILDKHNYVL